jgi:hypothetical protein
MELGKSTKVENRILEPIHSRRPIPTARVDFSPDPQVEKFSNPQMCAAFLGSNGTKISMWTKGDSLSNCSQTPLEGTCHPARIRVENQLSTFWRIVVNLRW